MGITKQYLRYVPAGNFNVISSRDCNTVFVTLEGQDGRFVAVGAAEHVFLWDLRLGEKAQVLPGEDSAVTCLSASPNKRHIAVGYADGSVKTFDLRSGEIINIFQGHKSAISALSYDTLGHKLASGGKDTDIIIWDVVADCGVCRLTGHKGSITRIAFMEEHDILISSSRDTFVKFWDLVTQHNFKTLVGHHSEVWDFCLVKNDRYLVSGCNDNRLHVWRIHFADEKSADLPKSLQEMTINDEHEVDDTKYPLRCHKIGDIARAGRGRVVSVRTDPTHSVIACHGVDSKIELFHMIPEDEAKAKQAKRLKKAMKKAESTDKDAETVDQSMALVDEVRRLADITVSSKVKALDMVMGGGGELRICTGLSNNSVELHSVSITEKNKEASCLRSLTAHGHRTHVRAICFSADNLAIATASGDSIKLWNRPTLSCLRTIPCGYALTATFVPGDRHLIVGLKDGKMLIVDVASGDILEEVPAHTKELSSVALFPDMKGVVSGGLDKTVKFWSFDLVEDPNSELKCKVLSVVHTRTLNLEEGVMCVKISPNNVFIAVALLDCTVKIFFVDSFKFFLALHSHSLPVHCMDFSSDSTLIATGSADRNVKIWGMDFGNVHKSLFAHDDSVTGLAFVPKTHYFFTCGKDGKVKQWDADNYQKIITLQGHFGEAWGCAVSPNGLYVASCGADRAIRLFEKSSEPLVLEDEAEEEREKQANELATGETTAAPGQKDQLMPSKKTVNAEKAAELILECLEISKTYKEECAALVPPKLPPLPLIMKAFNCNTPEEYLLETLKRIRAGDMEETLLLLPYSAAQEILDYLPNLLSAEYQAEILAKVALYLIKAHHGPILANPDLLPQVEIIRNLAMKRITDLRNTIGYNFHGMAFLQQLVEETQGIHLFRDATNANKKTQKKKKNKEKAVKRAILVL